MYIIIVGAGKVGYNLGKFLLSQGHEIMLIENDKSKMDNLTSEFSENVVFGDGTSPEVLTSAGIARADVVVAVTGEDEDNLVVGQIAKLIFVVPKTIARVNNPRNEAIFSSLGIDATVSATRMINCLIEEQVRAGDMVPILTLKGGDVEIVQVELTEKSPIVGKRIMDISLPEDSLFISIIRNDDVLIPKGDTDFRVEDKIIALVKKEKEQELRKLL